MILKENDAMAGLVGCMCILSVGLINGLVSVQTRMMQEISVIVTMFYVGLCATVLTAVWILIEHAVSGEGKLRILTLEFDQFLWCVLTGICNTLQLGFKTVAFANERSGLITMIGYVGLVYAFLADTFYLGETITVLELIGVALIFSINVIVIYCNQKQDNQDKSKSDDVEETMNSND